MQRILIIGAGGHAQVVADILLCAHAAGDASLPIGYVDDNPQLVGRLLVGLPVLGLIEDRDRIEHDALIVAVGSNPIRRRLCERLCSCGEHFAVARHPSAILASDVRIGPGTMICAGVIINPSSVIGAHVILNTGCTIEHHNVIADYTHIAPGVCLGGEAQVAEGGFIGIGATIMPQRRVGAWSVVGAGALVHRDLPENVIAIGVPARITKSYRLE